MPSSLPPPETCAVCGADIPRNARACPSCGADERTGWRETSIYDGLDLPDSAWEDDEPAPGSSEALRRRIRSEGYARQRRGELPWYWIAAGALIALLLAMGALRLL